MITVTEAKAYMQVTGTTYDALITGYRDYVESTIETYVDNKINSTTISGEKLSVIEPYDLQSYRSFDLNSKRLQTRTRYSPVASYTITDNGTTLVESTDYIMNTATGTITFLTSVTSVPSDLLITYTAGYTTCPNDLKMVALEMVKSLFQQGGVTTSGEGNVKSKSIGDFSVSYETAKNLFDQFSFILNRYKQFNV